jgi:hypothetical protein
MRFGYYPRRLGRSARFFNSRYNGASLFIFIYMMVVAIRHSCHFLVRSVTVSRDAISFGIAALRCWQPSFHGSYGAQCTRRANEQLGIGGHIISTVYFGTGSLAEQFVQCFLSFLFFFFVGAAVATVYLRWRMNGMIVFWTVLTLIGVGIAVLITMVNGWQALGSWLVTTGIFGLSVWSLVPTAIAALTAFLVLRRATPRN